MEEVVLFSVLFGLFGFALGHFYGSKDAAEGIDKAAEMIQEAIDKVDEKETP